MAGSRLEYIGTIFSRTTGLLRTKAIKYEDRPIWYDVYRVFPPKFEPRFDRQPELSEGMTEEVPNILYSEDISRAALFKKFGKNPGGRPRNLLNVTGALADPQEDAVKRFITKYNETKSAHNDWTSEQIVESISQDFAGTFSSGMRSRIRPSEKSETATSTTSASQRTGSLTPPYDQDDVDDDFDDSQIVDRPKRTKRPVVTVDTLISMFKKAKDSENKDDSEKK